MTVSQTTFADALMDASAPRPAGLSDGNGHVAGRRFDVYRNNVIVSLTEALETGFPVLAKLVGATNFKILARAYITQNPPSSPLMIYFGAQMSEFLNGFEPVQSIGYLPDIARLEFALRESYHAADAQMLDPQILGAMTPDALMQITLTFVPSLRLVRSQWPIHAIWQFNQAGGGPKPQMVAEDVLILRPELDPSPQVLPVGAGVFIQRLQAGATLSDALEAATNETEDFDLTQTLTLLIGAGAIHAIGDKK